MRFIRAIALAAAIVTGCWIAAPSAIGGDEAITVPAEPTVLQFVDPSQINGLIAETISNGTNSPHVYVSYPTFTHTSALNARLREEMTTVVRRFTHRAPDRPAPARVPELNVEWQIAAASHDVVGVRLRTAAFSGAATGTASGGSWTTSFRTLWYDPHSDRVLESHQLIAHLPDLATAVRERLRGSDTIDIGKITPDPALFDSIDFNHKGDLVVEFDDYAVATEAVGRVAVAIPRRQADPLLSAFGRRARDTVDAATQAEVLDSFPALETPDTPENLENLETSSPADTAAAGAAGPGAAGSRAGWPVDCAVAKCVALTFEDGPGPGTGRLLDILAGKGAKATFFTVGSTAQTRSDLLRRMRDEGHLIANHTWSHRDLTLLSESTVYAQLSRTQSAIGAATGQVPSLMRPPYGTVNSNVTAVARELGLAIVQWSVDTQEGSPRAIARQAIDGVLRSGARGGAIVTMHDVRPEAVDAVPMVLDELDRRGYTFVTVPELYGAHHMQPGTTYYQGPMSGDL